jgi:hypothetical protein
LPRRLVFLALATSASPRVDLDVVVVDDLDGDGDVEVDATVDGRSEHLREHGDDVFEQPASPLVLRAVGV